MKTILTIAASAAALASVGTAAAQESGQVYLELGLGAAFAVSDDETFEVSFEGPDGPITERGEGSIDLGTGASFHLLGGYEVTPNVAIEIEAQANAAEIGDSSIGLAVGAWTVNAVYSGDKSASVIPYAGVGVGYANPSFFDDDGDTLDDDFDGAFAYQVKAGVMKPVGVHHNFAAEVRYLGTGGFSYEFEDEFAREQAEIDYGAISATINYRFRFGQRP